ncbi:MAG: hypothetical protein OEY70_17205, partial [Acidimicrobiia bacterium]|nr:hypothetical protein [Acidimicrobiia bacterium]
TDRSGRGNRRSCLSPPLRIGASVPGHLPAPPPPAQEEHPPLTDDEQEALRCRAEAEGISLDALT